MVFLSSALHHARLQPSLPPHPLSFYLRTSLLPLISISSWLFTFSLPRFSLLLQCLHNHSFIAILVFLDVCFFAFALLLSPTFTLAVGVGKDYVFPAVCLYICYPLRRSCRFYVLGDFILCQQNCDKTTYLIFMKINGKVKHRPINPIIIRKF